MTPNVRRRAPASKAKAQSGGRRAPKAAEGVLLELRRQIACGEIAEDGNLPTEGELVAQFGVSRTPVREAIRVLEMEGLVRSNQGARHGARVQPPSARIAARHTGLLLRRREASLADVYEARVAIEPQAARLLAERATPEIIGRLKALLAAERKCVKDAKAWGRAAADFHVAVMDLCGNQTLAVLGLQLDDIIAGQSAVEMVEAGSSQEAERVLADEAHERLVTLVERRDGAKAEAFWRSHLEAAWPAYRVTESLRVEDLLK